MSSFVSLSFYRSRCTLSDWAMQNIFGDELIQAVVGGALVILAVVAVLAFIFICM